MIPIVVTLKIHLKVGVESMLNVAWMEVEVGFEGNPILECSSETFIKTFFLYKFFYLIGSCDPTDPFGCVQYDCIPGDPSCYK